jgi:hypothetical protein
MTIPVLAWAMLQFDIDRMENSINPPLLASTKNPKKSWWQGEA